MDTLQTIVIDSANFLQGESINKYTSDAGYSSQSKGVNLFKEKGVLNFQGSNMDYKLLDGQMIAAIQDPNFLSNYAYLLTDNGSLYTVDASLTSAGVTLRQTDATVGHNYTFGTSDMVWFRGALYATCDVDVMYVTGANLTTADKTWWVTTKGKTALQPFYRHPIEVVEDRMYFADGQYINTWDGTTAVEHDITIPPNYNITAMHKHPNGRDLIAFASENTNFSNTVQSRGATFIINTITGEYIQQTTVDDQVEGAKLVGGILYVSYGAKIGYFTDTGIVYLRDLDIEYPISGDDLGYKHNLGNMEGHLLIAENTSILAMGDLGAGKVWWHPTISPTGDKINGVFYVGSKMLLYSTPDGFGGDNLYFQNLGSTSTSGIYPTFYTNKYDLPKKAWVRRIEIEHETIGVSSSFQVSGIDKNGGTTTLGFGSYSAGNTDFTRIDCNYYTGMVQLGIRCFDKNLGIKKITIYYEMGEL